MSRKVKIPYERKKDLDIINEEIFKIMHNTTEEINEN